MTDASESHVEPPAESTTSSRLTELQRVDTAADQLSNRRERLAERAALTEASDALSEWERERTAMRARIEELSAAIEKAEDSGGELAEHKVRLEAQMKTVIAPREAEALMSEMATIDGEIDELDLTELAALEEQSDVDDRLTAHLTAEGALRDAVGAADAALQRVTAEIDTELGDLASRRDAQRSEMSDAVLARYDRVRSSSGVAVASITGKSCTGCHLDLSAAEIDDVKDEAAANDGVADCPNCGRMLAR
jgi:predicted  nucleic acid-binding Zn-ribbon protein